MWKLPLWIHIKYKDILVTKPHATDWNKIVLGCASTHSKHPTVKTNNTTYYVMEKQPYV